MTPAPRQGDRYPSRSGGPPRVLPRLDPVLHGGDAAPGPLSGDELRRFDRDGWLVLRGAFAPDEAAALHRAAAQGGDGAMAVIEPDSAAVRSLFAVHRGDGPLARALADRRLVGPARQILADEVAFHQSRVNLKPAFDGRDFWWHSDFETWHVEDGLPAMRVLSAMLMLTANTAANGPLLVVPGSHRSFVACAGTTPEAHHASSLRRQEYGLPDRLFVAELAAQRRVEAVLGSPGDVVVFDGNLLHGSGGNLSPDARCNLFAVYNAVSNRPSAPFGGRPPRPEHVAERAPAAIVPRSAA